MKKNLGILAIIGLFSMTILSGCGNSEKKQESPSERSAEQYQCPMKCTEEVFDKPGTCPVCGMELEKITKS